MQILPWAVQSHHLDESDRESEDDFHPELFGLLDNPGVVRFGCLEYPLAVTEYKDDEDIADAAPDWIRVSYDDLTMGKDYVMDSDSDRMILSRSLDDIINICMDKEGRRIQRCDCHTFGQIYWKDYIVVLLFNLWSLLLSVLLEPCCVSSMYFQISLLYSFHESCSQVLGKEAGSLRCISVTRHQFLLFYAFDKSFIS